MTRNTDLPIKLSNSRQLRKVLIVGALILATPVHAQMTNCTDHGSFLTCNSTDGSFMNCNKVGNMLNCHRMVAINRTQVSRIITMAAQPRVWQTFFIP